MRQKLAGNKRTYNTEEATKQSNIAGSHGSALAPPAYGLEVLDQALSAPLHAKLAISPTNSIYEREANQMADQVIGAGEMSRSAQPSHPIGIQRTATEGAAQAMAPPIVHETLRQPGKPMDSQTRRSMESRFGQDFSGVRLHTNAQAAASAEAVNAHAYTVGKNIVFGQNEYVSGHASKHLLAHELSHVVQQTGTLQRYRKKGGFNYGKLDDPPIWVEQPFKNKEKQPWIQKIIITFTNKVTDAAGNDTWQGKLSALYYPNEAELPAFTIGMSGGSIQVGNTDEGRFTVHRIEGFGYNSGSYTTHLPDGGIGPRGRYSPEGLPANMHWAVFYNRGEAIHAGPLGESSHGCVHIGEADLRRMRQINYHSVIGRTKVTVKYPKRR